MVNIVKNSGELSQILRLRQSLTETATERSSLKIPLRSMAYILQLNIFPFRRFKAQNFQTGSHENLRKIRHVISIPLRYKT